MKTKLLNLWRKLPRAAQILLPTVLLLLLLWNLFRLVFPPAPVWIGYVEGEYLYVTSPVAGYLEDLAVQRGQTVEKDSLLFQLEGDPEQQLRDQDRARLEQAKADLVLAEQSYDRSQKLLDSGALSRQQFDERTRDWHAAREAVSRSERALSESDWRLSRKTQIAREAGLVHDTYYLEGDWIEAGRPVLSLLSPGQIKARFFIPEPEIARVHRGQQVCLRADGLDRKLYGIISYISEQAEYTPPVIYSVESREKLVFLVEASFTPEDAVLLHPGLPISISPEEDVPGS